MKTANLTKTETKQQRAERINQKSRLPKVERIGSLTRWTWTDRIVELDGTKVRHLIHRQYFAKREWEDVAGWPGSSHCETKAEARRLARLECKAAGLRAEYEDDKD